MISMASKLPYRMVTAIRDLLNSGNRAPSAVHLQRKVAWFSCPNTGRKLQDSSIVSAATVGMSQVPQGISSLDTYAWAPEYL